MKCYNCGGFLYESDICPECGADVSSFRRIVKKSNELYNRGLGFARDRNLSKAIECLKVSLKMYKGNVNARNLLGLIYMELGEYTQAFAQWVISQSLQEENNLADYFMEELQKNKQYVNLMNLTIRKYNKAIAYINQGDFDLAEIQLKKLLNDNANYVKGHQLLALLLIRKKKFAEARIALRKAEKIDAGNPLTISYMTYVNGEIKSEEMELSPAELKEKRQAEKPGDDRAPLSGDDVIIPKSSYREYNPGTMAVIQIIIGVVIGAALIFFIILPAKTKALRSEYASQIESLTSKVEQLEAASGLKADENEQNGSIEIQSDELNNYKALVAAYAAMDNRDRDAAKSEIDKVVNPDKMDKTFKGLYETLKSELDVSEYEAIIAEGVELYNSGEWTNSLEKLMQPYDAGVKTENVLYYIGRDYDYLNDFHNTVKYLREYLETYPDGEFYETADQIVYNWEH